MGKILTDVEADLAWYFSPYNHSPDVYRTKESFRLSERDICLLEAQDRKTREEIFKAGDFLDSSLLLK